MEIDTEMDLDLQSHLSTDSLMNLVHVHVRVHVFVHAHVHVFVHVHVHAHVLVLKLIQEWTWSSRAIYGKICI